MGLDKQSLVYEAGSTLMHSYLVHSDTWSEPAPAVLVFPEWWGLNDYIRSRANQMAELGYVAMAVDMYGDGQTVDHPEQAAALMNGVLNDPDALEDRLEQAFITLANHPAVDPNRIGAMGYCFGGALALNLARFGTPLKAVTSFHGALDSAHTPEPGSVQTKILVCHGAADPFVGEESVAAFKAEMETAQIDYEFIAYEGVLHGFTNPAATERGEKFGLPLKYDAEADQASWQAMQAHFSKHL